MDNSQPSRPTSFGECEEVSEIVSCVALELWVIVLSFLPDEDVPYFALTCNKILSAFYCSKRKIVYDVSHNLTSLSRIRELPREKYNPYRIMTLIIKSNRLDTLVEYVNEKPGRYVTKSLFILALKLGHVDIAKYIERYVKICWTSEHCKCPMLHITAGEMLESMSIDKAETLDFLDKKLRYISTTSLIIDATTTSSRQMSDILFLNQWHKSGPT